MRLLGSAGFMVTETMTLVALETSIASWREYVLDSSEVVGGVVAVALLGVALLGPLAEGDYIIF